MPKSRTYNGNPNLARAGSTNNYTPEQVADIIRCMDDPIYFAEEHFRIVHPDHGLIKIALYDFQKEAINLYQNERKFLLVTARQIGKTSIATVIILHFAIFNKNKKIAVLANKGETAREILDRIQLAYEHLPSHIKCGVTKWNESTIEFENGSSIFAGASSSDAVRGRSYALVYIDEVAFVEHWLDFSASVLPTLSSGRKSKLILTSTPRGLNHFYDYVQGAKAGTNGFRYLEVPWYMVPGRDEAWKQEVLETINHDSDRFNQEYNCSFNSQSGTLIDGSHIRRMIAAKPLSNEGDFVVYEKAKSDIHYFIVVDVSRGKTLDYSVAMVMAAENKKFRQVAMFRSNTIPPLKLAMMVRQIASQYNDAFVLVETNDAGIQVAESLAYDLEYENMIRSVTKGRAGKAPVFSHPKAELGVTTSRTVKAIGCLYLKSLIEKGMLTVVDKTTINEFASFVSKGVSYEANAGHDDTVMTLVLFAWMVDSPFYVNYFDENTRDELYRKYLEDDDTALPIGGFQNGISEELIDSYRI